jgi:hypothetical protein
LEFAERKNCEIEDLLHQGRLTEQQAIEARINAQRKADLARKRIDDLGPCPEPGLGYSKKVTGSNVIEVWLENRNALSRKLESKKQIEERLQNEAEVKTAQRLSAERARKLAQQEADKQEKKLRDAQQKQKELEKNMVDATAKKLCNKTIEQLDQAIQALDTYAKETVKATFAEQAKLLKAAIDEKLLEPLNAEIAQKQAIQDVIAKGEAAVQAERIRLEQGLKDIQDVHRMTLKRLQAA